MSRCVPFPPPGYETARTYHEARIQSMKLLKEKEIAKKDGKKQKRQEKKQKRKAEKGIEVENEKHGHKRRHKDERCQEDKKRGSNKKMEESGVQQLDKSSLTEEYRHPLSPLRILQTPLKAPRIAAAGGKSKAHFLRACIMLVN
ncbi:unnamed protein product [Rhodiola kirilowii]